jgi:hypothetical protein
MQKIGASIVVSASDLVGHLNCQHLTDLDKAVATGALEKPKVWDPLLQLLWERGARHERAFVDHLKSQGFGITLIEGIGVDDQAVGETRDAMAAGDEVIVQGAFRLNGWVGRTDVLRRVETASDLGNWSYEVIDTKLARETKGGTVLQLCLVGEVVVHSVDLRDEIRPRCDDVAEYRARSLDRSDQIKGHGSEGRRSFDAVPFQFIYMDPCDPRHERKMVVGASTLVTTILPSARIAVFLRLRIYLARLMLANRGF